MYLWKGAWFTQANENDNLPIPLDATSVANKMGTFPFLKSVKEIEQVWTKPNLCL